MADPIKVKAVKAAGGPPTDDELDQLEVLVGLGVKIAPDQLQRLIEAARARASPTPTLPPEAPTPRLRRRVVVPEPVTEPMPRYQAPPPLPPPRRRRRRQPPPPPPRRRVNVLGTIVAALLVLGVGTPLISFLVSTVAISTGRPITAQALGIVDLVTAGVLLLIIIGAVAASGGRPPARDSPAPDPDEDDDDEDDEDQWRRYRDERWQGDHGYNGRDYEGRGY